MMAEELVGAYGGRLIIAVIGVAIGLACLIGVLWIIRGRRGPSPFVRGGKNRQPRLQVLDAAAVDTRRRLVLVRRDDTEHLIMIGGPTDIVIESGISTSRAPAALTNEAPTAVTPKLESRDTPQVAARMPAAPVIPQPRPEPRQELPKPAAPAVDVAPRNPLPAAAPVPPQPPVPAAMPVQPQPPVSQKFQATIAPVAPAIATPIAASVTAAPAQARAEPAFNDAADILDAARSRVFQGPSVPVRTAPPDLLIPNGDGPRPLGSDFERVLEEEMASNLAARETPALPQRPADKPAVTGATSDPSLQAEVARIFGEMSVTRDT